MDNINNFVENLSVIDSHNHIGSINSMGFYDNFAFIGDLHPGAKAPNTNLIDIILSPYYGSLLASLGASFNLTPPSYAIWSGIKKYVTQSMGTGQYIVYNLSFKDLYGFSLDELIEDDNKFNIVNDSVLENYKNGLYTWNKEIYNESKIKYSIKPVHLGYIKEMNNVNSNEWLSEQAAIKPIFRIDDLLGFITNEKHLDFSYIEGITNIHFNSVKNIKAAVCYSFNLLKENNITAIKQLQAYSRTLKFTEPDDDTTNHSLNRLYDSKHQSILQDYIHKLILEKANDLNMTYQIHTGMTNLPFSNPANLTNIIESYPNINFVLLHCYPYISEAGYLARTYKNVYLDASWLAIQSPTILYNALNEWIGFVPYTKICISSDGTNTEEIYGAIKLSKIVLSQVLTEKINKFMISKSLAYEIAKALLYENSSNLYGDKKS